MLIGVQVAPRADMNGNLNVITSAVEKFSSSAGNMGTD